MRIIRYYGLVAAAAIAVFIVCSMPGCPNEPGENQEFLIDSLISRQDAIRDSVGKEIAFWKHEADSLKKKLTNPVKPAYVLPFKITRNITQDSAAAVLGNIVSDPTIKSSSEGIVVSLPTTLNLIDGQRELQACRDYNKGLSAYADSLSDNINLFGRIIVAQDSVIELQDTKLLVDLTIRQLMQIDIAGLKDDNASLNKENKKLKRKSIIMEIGLVGLAGAATYIVIDRSLK